MLGAKIVALMPRNWGGELSICIEGINRYLQGWMGFFGICCESELRLLKTWDAHIRRRLRAIKLKQWKRKHTIARQLIALGARAKTAWSRIYAGKQSVWQMSINAVVQRTLKNSYFADLGLVTLENLWHTYQLKHATVAVETCK